MIYLLALVTVILIGTLGLRLIVAGRFPFYLGLFLGTALGLGIASQIIFYLQLLGNNFNHFLPLLISLGILGLLLWRMAALKLKIEPGPFNPTLWILVLLAIPLWFEAHYYYLGGWDAWSCWNLKAKFIYLGQERWRDLFDPLLWGSNTGYPLALPTINVWFWQWSGFSQSVPMLNAIVLTLLTAGTLLLGLQELKAPLLYCILAPVAIFTLAFGNTLCISQYSDMLFGLYLLCALVCYFLAFELNNNRLLIPTAIFIGLMSFTKNEGLAASAILTLLILSQRPQKAGRFITVLLLAAVPTIIFTFTIAPKSEAFINGLLSMQKPSTFSRLGYILLNTIEEFLSFKWNGLWIIAAIGLILAGKNILKQPFAIIGLFVAAYLSVVLAYYQINTFFEIGWWMNITLNRIIFVLMPAIFLWMGLSLFKKGA